MAGTGVIVVQGVEIHLMARGEEDYISLTDMVSGFDGGAALIDTWLRNKNTLEFLAVWERMNNPDFNSVEFDGIRLEAGTNRFRISAKQWMQRVGGVGVIAKAGRYGGTFAHRDIAFEFGSWLSPEFKLYLIKEFQRLKEQESKQDKLEWNIRRTLTKTNYVIHTDAIKEHLIPPTLPQQQVGIIYASEADVLNKALFGMTAKEWRQQNQDKKGNIRDDATIQQLVVLANLEAINATMIHQGIPQSGRLVALNQIAQTQMRSLLASPTLKGLETPPLLKGKE